MNDKMKEIARQKWFVPLVLFLLAAVAVSSFLMPGGEKTDTITLETQIEEMCNALTGVSDAKVMLTYRAVPASNFFSAQSGGEEILGIAVLCKGGDDPNVQLSIHQLLKTLFQISSTQITVSGKN